MTRDDKIGRPPTTKRGKERCTAAYTKGFNNSTDPRQVPIFVDVDCSPTFAQHGVDIAPCVTRTRGGEGGPWVSTRGRQTTVYELMRLQGLCPKDIPFDDLELSTRQVGFMVGNAVSVNTIGCILTEALSSAGFPLDMKAFPM